MLVLDDRTEFSYCDLHTEGRIYMTIYNLDTRYGASTREVTIYHDLDKDAWSGDISEFGTWYKLDKEDVEQARKFIEEKTHATK